MALTQVLLFILIWCALMAIPVKLGLLPEVAAKLENTSHRAKVLVSPLWCHFLSDGRRAKFKLDLEFRELLEGIVNDYGHSPIEHRGEDAPRLRPEAAQRIEILHSRAMMLGLGSFVGDVLGTYRKVLFLAQSGSHEDAYEQVTALRGRISAHDHYSLPQYCYYPYGQLDAPIGQVASRLRCGTDTPMIENLTHLCHLTPGDDTIAQTCATWIEAFEDRASAFVDYIEQYAGRVTKRGFISMLAAAQRKGIM